jgi:hypothetical protein
MACTPFSNLEDYWMYSLRTEEPHRFKATEWKQTSLPSRRIVAARQD